MSALLFRSVYPEDINQILKIENDLTGSERRTFLEKRLAVATTVPDSYITYAVLDSGRLAGYGFARILEGEYGVKSSVAVLDTVGVDPDYQGKGIGKMIMSGIERRMKNKNIGTLQTEIEWKNRAMIRFFASTGFILATGQVIERDTSPLSGGVGGPAESPAVVRMLRGEDIACIDRIDAKLTGLDRSAYYATKFREMLDEPDDHISMVTVSGGAVTGFIMARIDYGEFGIPDKSAVIDTIGVHPEYAGTGIGHSLLSHLLATLSGLEIKSVRTKIEFENSTLRDFLSKLGFRPSQRVLLTRIPA